MAGDRTITIYFRRNDGELERVPLTHSTLAEALRAIECVFYVSGGLYTGASICEGNELIETIENPECVRVESLLAQ